MKTIVKSLLVCTALLPAALAAASAQELPATELSVVGSWSNLPLYQQFENTFWTETIPAESNGAITVTMTTFDQMGIAGGDVFRMLSDGIFDIGMTV